MASEDTQMAGAEAAKEDGRVDGTKAKNAPKKLKSTMTLSVEEAEDEVAKHEQTLISQNTTAYFNTFTDIGDEGVLVSTDRSSKGRIRSVDLLNFKGGSKSNLIATQGYNNATLCKPANLEAALTFCIHEYAKKGHKMVMATFECKPTKDEKMRVPMHLGNPPPTVAAADRVSSRIERKRGPSPARGSQQGERSQQGGRNDSSGKRRRYSPSRPRYNKPKGRAAKEGESSVEQHHRAPPRGDLVYSQHNPGRRSAAKPKKMGWTDGPMAGLDLAAEHKILDDDLLDYFEGLEGAPEPLHTNRDGEEQDYDVPVHEGDIVRD
ncbi:hypothetical protein ACHAQA_005675 [Verticillium albo-atrum]